MVMVAAIGRRRNREAQGGERAAKGRNQQFRNKRTHGASSLKGVNHGLLAGDINQLLTFVTRCRSTRGVHSTSMVNFHMGSAGREGR
jgi:hypothetical protein